MPDAIMHVELRIDDCVIMMGDSSDQIPSNQYLIHVYVSDVDETYNKGIKIRCILLVTPTQRDGEPNRRGSFKDFSGNVWSIAKQIEQPN